MLFAYTRSCTSCCSNARQACTLNTLVLGLLRSTSFVVCLFVQFHTDTLAMLGTRTHKCVYNCAYGDVVSVYLVHKRDAHRRHRRSGRCTAADSNVCVWYRTFNGRDILVSARARRLAYATRANHIIADNCTGNVSSHRCVQIMPIIIDHTGGFDQHVITGSI